MLPVCGMIARVGRNLRYFPRMDFPFPAAAVEEVAADESGGRYGHLADDFFATGDVCYFIFLDRFKKCGNGFFFCVNQRVVRIHIPECVGV